MPEKIYQIKDLRKFVKERGAEILKNTNEYELLRFKSKNITGIVYTTKNSKWTFTGEAKNAWDCMKNKKPWEGENKKKRKPMSVLHKSILERDGDNCFYCSKELLEDATIEHLLSVNCGGNNHINNLVLSHYECNKKAGHKSIIEKVLLRDKLTRG